MTEKIVVLLVDDRRRDLLGNALIARHLRDNGVRVYLEPINAWQAVLGAHRPHMIVFNHLGAKHLADYSQRLHQLGVLTAVLPNEGILYNGEVLDFNARSLYPQMHCDYFFCWNGVHREALVRHHYCATDNGAIEVGIPRFDFYREPWRRVFERPVAQTGRPQILACGNFPLAHYHELPPEYADHFFGRWTEGIPSYQNYRSAIQSNFEARTKFFPFVEALVKTNRYDITLRPHPRESADLYLKWMGALPSEQKPHVRLAMQESISELILNHDLQVSCEHCTTALESWIIGKPTIELVSEKHPFWHFPERNGLNVECSEASKLPAMVEEALRHPEQKEFAVARRAHLQKWCSTVDGNSAKRIADHIVESLKESRPPLRLNFQDWRRGMKLKAFQFLGEPYTYPPVLKLLKNVKGEKMKLEKRWGIYQKSIKPHEATEADALLKNLRETQSHKD